MWYFFSFITLIHFFLFPIFTQNDLAIIGSLKNLGGIVNTKSDEFAPTLSADASFIIFNSKRSNKYQDLYISYFDFVKNKWKKPTPMLNLNSPYNDETPFLSKDGKILLFSSDRDGSLEMPKNQFGKIKVSFDLYFSQRTKQGWSSPKKVQGNINTVHHEKSPSISSNKKTLYYTMWKFGNIRHTVIMQAQLKNGIFINPRPLPKIINSGFQELALVESANGDGFYFSSLRPKGFGGWDIYYISFKNNLFGKVINLGKKINSEKNDTFLSHVDQLYFISSDRKGGKGRFDIYSTFIFEENKNFETRMIYFDFNSAELKKRSHSYLNALSKFLKKTPKTKLKVVGHTDLHGSVELNLKLSKNRAQSVKKYLVKSGISDNRLKIQGLGKNQPFINKIGNNFDYQNRRIEFFIKK